ncbi:hypothetical protein [Algoriphagus antarcticus]|uniref:Lipocalin-like protein n=1 Tax=Algoriphagus antarcticus TaxID=238540 RepID=A0A3E0DPK6_9BACT|nr:hypothetical protein [Algoriphagus antarcticus]REG84723.1 hypothetical protein C8N25_11472 [Algoriphagus antarcticus]
MPEFLIIKNMRILLSFILVIFYTSSFSQNFEGKYSGNFLDPETLLTIELKKGQYTAIILTSSKTSFVLDCEVVESSLLFSVPMNDEKELQVTAVSMDHDLELSFTLEGQNYTTLLSRFGGKIDSKENVEETRDKPSLNPELIGKWIQLETYDASGKPVDGEYSGKGYYRIYTKDGRLIVDPQRFRDESSKNGRSFSYSDVPTFIWTTFKSNILVTNLPGIIEIEEEYLIKGDSLSLKTDKNFITFFRKGNK